MMMIAQRQRWRTCFVTVNYNTGNGRGRLLSSLFFYIKRLPDKAKVLKNINSEHLYKIKIRKDIQKIGTFNCQEIL